MTEKLPATGAMAPAWGRGGDHIYQVSVRQSGIASAAWRAGPALVFATSQGETWLAVPFHDCGNPAGLSGLLRLLPSAGETAVPPCVAGFFSA